MMMKVRTIKLWIVLMALLSAALIYAQPPQQNTGIFPQLSGGFERSVNTNFRGVNSAPAGAFHTVYTLDKAFNYSLKADAAEVSLNVAIQDVAGSGIDFTNATLEGSWLYDGTYYTYNNVDETSFLSTSGAGGEKFVYDPDTKVYSVSVPILSSNTAGWQFAIRTDDGKRYGLWSFDGLNGDEVKMQTYKIKQQYNFATAQAPGNIVDDYKLLVVVDGTSSYPFRNNKYLSILNATSGNDAGGGGGVIIKNGLVTFDGIKTIVGSTAANTWSVGFMVVDSIAGLIVTTGNTLAMNNATSNGTSPVTGQRLIIEKGFNSCGIFGLERGTLNVETNGSSKFIAIYHHLLSTDRFSWMSDPKDLILTDGSIIDGLMYTASSINDNFISSATPDPKNILIYGYDEYQRATTAPSLDSEGTAWNKNYPNTNSSLPELVGIIVAGTTPGSDLYMDVPLTNLNFFNTSASPLSPGLASAVTTTVCNRQSQYDAAAIYLGKPVLSNMDSYDPTVKALVASYHSGWNLVGNVYNKPYIPDNSLVIAIPAPDGSNNYIYKNIQSITLNTSTQNDVTSDFPGSTADNFIIPVLTPFFVQTPAPSASALAGSTSPSVIFNTGSLSNDNSLYVNNPNGFRSALSSNQEPQYIRLDLLDKNDVRVGQTVLSFAEGATPVKDWGWDVPLMGADSTDIYMPDAMGAAMAINVIGSNPGSVFSAPIGINLNETGIYKFRISEIKNMSDVDLVLKEGNKKTEIHEGDIYPFTINTRGKNETIFSIARLKQTTGIDENKNSDKPFVYAENNWIVVDNIQERSDIRVLDVMGRLIAKATTSGPMYTFPLEAKGHYLIQVIQGKNSYVFKVSI